MKYYIESRRRGISCVCTITRREGNWIGRKCLLMHITEGENKGKERSDGETRKKA